ncbi:MAG: nucleotide sugar dehydrogenase [Rhizomicrobium sp.]
MSNPSISSHALFRSKIEDKSVAVGIIGLGYVGLPLARAFCQAGVRVVGFDNDDQKIEKLGRSETYIAHIPSDTIAGMREGGRFTATADYSELAKVDAVLICVPTPLKLTREPDLDYVVATTRAIVPHLRRGMAVVLESTTYPGTTTEVVVPILEESGLRAGVDFLVAFSPERENPGGSHPTSEITKIVGGLDAECGESIAALYGLAFARVATVSNAATAEAVKITENVFRAVNIALANELKLVYTRMGIDVWEVIEAAKTKPFGYMAFYPGPGLGGHCIPIDPFYLSWRARAFEFDTRFIELAGEINREMPRIVVQTLSDSLSLRFRRALNGARILVMGVAYKKNIDDVRESPALHIMDLIRAQGGEVEYYDAHCPRIPRTRAHGQLEGMQNVTFDRKTVSEFDAALIVTDHDGVDYQALVNWSKLVVDTRNACGALRHGREKVVRA